MDFRSLLIVHIFWSGLINAEAIKGQGFKLSPILASKDINGQKFPSKLETVSNEHVRTLIECCSFCLAKSPPCEGVQFDKEKGCTLLANIIPSNSGTSTAWIMVPLSSRNKAKVLLVSGNHRNMELVNLATKQSFVFDYPVQWAQGGQISENLYYFCNYDAEKVASDRICATVNIDTLEIEQTGVTTQYQQRAVGLTIEHEGKQVIWLTGTSRSSQITSLTENKVGARPELPIHINAHCMLRLNTSTVAVLAGMDINPWVNNKRMWYYHVQDDQWVDGPSLRVGRRWAGCGTFKCEDSTYILVVGGTAAEGGKSVEVLNVRGNAWVDGKKNIFHLYKTVN